MLCLLNIHQAGRLKATTPVKSLPERSSGTTCGALFLLHKLDGDSWRDRKCMQEGLRLEMKPSPHSKDSSPVHGVCSTRWVTGAPRWYHLTRCVPLTVCARCSCSGRVAGFGRCRVSTVLRPGGTDWGWEDMLAQPLPLQAGSGCGSRADAVHYRLFLLASNL